MRHFESGDIGVILQFLEPYAAPIVERLAPKRNETEASKG
jgi:hypothetical protein